ncbi:hypothetical protein M5689_023639 [Euphorbia peplus]|nr:hypothetical protein M5689_023639 [Euphorbia peplus]
MDLSMYALFSAICFVVLIISPCARGYDWREKVSEEDLKKICQTDQLCLDTWNKPADSSNWKDDEKRSRLQTLTSSLLNRALADWVPAHSAIQSSINQTTDAVSKYRYKRCVTFFETGKASLDKAGNTDLRYLNCATCVLEVDSCLNEFSRPPTMAPDLLGRLQDFRKLTLVLTTIAAKTSGQDYSEQQI